MVCNHRTISWLFVNSIVATTVTSSVTLVEGRVTFFHNRLNDSVTVGLNRRSECIFRCVFLVQFTDNFVTASTTLSVVVVRWDRHNVSWVDLNDHDTCTTEVTKVVKRTEVQTSRTSAILVVVHFVTWHLYNLTHRVIHGARVAVEVVVANFLVSKEVTIWSDRQVALFQEVVQFVNRTLRWVGVQILHEVDHRFNWETLLKHSDHASSHSVVKRFALPEQIFTLDRHVALTVAQYDFLRLDDILNQIPVASFDSVENFLIGNMSFGDGVALVTNYHDDVVTLNQKWVSHDIFPFNYRDLSIRLM